MRSFRLDPYLWIHLAGAAAVPIFLELCFLGLSVGDPILPLGLEFLLIAAIGIAPIAWMQWQKPFYIFSLLVIALQPSQLTDEQRQILRLFKTMPVKVLTVIVSVGLAVVLWQLFQTPPIPTSAIAFMPQGRLSGLLIAAIAFFLSHLFLQVPVSVVRVLVASESEIKSLSPYPVEQIAQDFMVLGLRVSSILPEMTLESPKVAPAPSAPVSPNLVDSGMAEDDIADPWMTDASDETSEPTSESVPELSEQQADAEPEASSVPPLDESQTQSPQPEPQDNESTADQPEAIASTTDINGSDAATDIPFPKEWRSPEPESAVEPLSESVSEAASEPVSDSESESAAPISDVAKDESNRDEEQPLEEEKPTSSPSLPADDAPASSNEST
jgi:hypothetical protein